MCFLLAFLWKKFFKMLLRTIRYVKCFQLSFLSYFLYFDFCQINEISLKIYTNEKRILSVSLIKVATALAIRTFLCCRWRYKFLLKKLTKWHNCRAVIYCFYICAFISIETEPIFFLKIPKTAELPGSVLLYLHFCVCITVDKAKELTLLMIPHFAAVAMYLSIQQFISAKIVILLYCKIM